MTKFRAFVLILLLSPLVAGLYGVVHDQLTFAVSAEYYTKFKFEQFNMWWAGENIGTVQAPEIIPRYPRLAVALVGFLATWWVGLLIGLVMGIMGLAQQNGSTMFRTGIKGLLLCLCITLVLGLTGLAYGQLFLVKNPPSWWMPEHLIERDRFIMVGSMHNFSYLGALIGLVAGMLFSVRQKRKSSPRDADAQRI